MEEYHLEGHRKAKECLLTRGVPMTTLYRTPVVSTKDIKEGRSLLYLFKKDPKPL